MFNAHPRGPSPQFQDFRFTHIWSLRRKISCSNWGFYLMTNKYRKMCEIYKIFAKDWDCDFSEQAMQDMYNYETFGKGNINEGIFNGNKTNGYAVGKKWLNVTVDMWFQEADMYGWHPLLQRLYADKFPHWWLDEVFKDFMRSKADYYAEQGMKLDLSYKDFS